MTKDEILHNLSLLPEWLIEANTQSWDNTIKAFAQLASIHEEGIPRRLANYPNVWALNLDLLQRISELEQAKLFRVGSSLRSLMISTKEKHGLENGDPYIFCNADKDKVEIGYYSAAAVEAEDYTCKRAEFITVLLPLLDRLWNETRSRKNV